MKLIHKFSLINVMLLFTAITITSLYTLHTIKGEFKRRAVSDLEGRMKSLHELLAHKGTELRVVDGKLIAGGYVINGNFELPDKIKEIFGGSATIFMGDVRISTNVIKPDGSRAVGTKLQGPAYDAVIKGGKPFRGEAPILGVPYFTAYDPIRDASGKVIGVLYVGSRQDEYMAVYNRLRYVLMGMAVTLAAALSLLSSMLVRRSLLPLVQIVEINHRLADGDLSMDIAITGTDEVGQLADSSRKVMSYLNVLITSIKNTAHEVASASSLLAAVTEQISTSSHQVVDQMVAVSHASEQMSSTSLEIASNCGKAAGSSDQGNLLTTQGRAVVQESIAGMSRIAEKVKGSAETVESLGRRSEEIGEIIGTIEDIADQTNLLALNAAIEAARAGDQGRGFAVVADEVRALASRTATATKEISAMINAIQKETKGAVTSMEESVTEVEKGSRDAAKSGEALGEILEQIKAVAEEISHISIAAEEQTATTTEITGNIMMVTEVIQLSASCSNDASAAATTLSTQADELLRLVGRFTLAA